MENKTAVITGVTGQDGSYLAELLLSKGYRVVGLYRRSSVPTFERVEHLRTNPSFLLACADVTDYASVNSILHSYRPDEVYNLAAQSHVAVSFNQPSLTWDITAKGCMNLLESLRYLYSDNYQPRFYQASSSEMFGDQYSLSNDEKFQDEDTTMNPQSPYAIAKLAAHNMTRLYRNSYGMYTSNGILFNHESPRRGENFVTRKITKYISKIYHEGLTFGSYLHAHGSYVHFGNTNLNSEKLAIPKLQLGNLDACRDWGFAGDYVEAMWLMLQQHAGDDFVICTGETHTVREFCEHAFSYLGLNWNDFVTVDKKFMRPSEVPFLKGKYDKANRKLGWKPKVSFEELVHRMVQSDIDGKKKIQ